ncbi:zinc finger protein Rlf [Chanos chanos]|uniref:Zinc finger protein Rlf n=1 Tax=Chanos chanos TaxID=29144 RepID=A0A6J2WCY1_CHACN|nr:zinc finger protein Rlf [Chanos chanos]
MVHLAKKSVTPTVVTSGSHLPTRQQRAPHISHDIVNAYALWLGVKMADGSVDAEPDWRDRPNHTAEDTLLSMESLQATLQQLEAELQVQDISETSSSEYCNNFCQALMHYAGSRNSVEHGLSLLEAYCLSINCFAAARPHLTANSDSVALVLKRLALSCFELLLSVPSNEIPFDAWVQFHRSVQAAHDALLQYGSTDLQALLQITGEGGAWSNSVLVDLLTGQSTDPEEVNAYIAMEGEGFMEMRIKHLEKVGEVEKALVLTKACANCSLIPNQASFRQTFVYQLCQLLPSEEAIMEISRLDGKDVLDIICNMETEGDENTAFILCTTYLTQQLQQENLCCSWELTFLWSKLHRRIDMSIESFLERCLQLGAIAKTVYHLLFLIRVIQTETMQFGLGVSVELCVKALQLPRQEDIETRTTVCKTVACLLPEDLEMLRACQLTEFLLEPSQEAFNVLEELYRRPDQKYDEENAIIPNSLRCELLLALKAHWPFDPEFWDWKTLKHHCIRLLGLETEEEEEEVPEETSCVLAAMNEEAQDSAENEQELKSESRRSKCSHADQEGKRNEEISTGRDSKVSPKKKSGSSERNIRWQKYKVFCHICQKEVIEARIFHHSRKHVENGVWTCPVCLEKFQSKKEFTPHFSSHLQMPAKERPQKKKKVKKKSKLKKEMDEDDFDDLEPGQIALDPSVLMYYQSTHDPDVLEHILEQAAAVPQRQADDDYITFDYISTYFEFQNREVYPCPATNCSKNFKLFKYLSVHLKAEHDKKDQNVKHYLEMKDRRQKCTFCRRHFMTAYHHRKHRRVHYGDSPYMCVVTGCGARFSTTNELVAHKQNHGFQVSYQCELKGCSLSFCDLGQLYHHEAQHFRDAAYTCTSPGCKKFYYSRKEFLKHLATHGITFTEEDFETQRRKKKKPVDPVVEEVASSKDASGTKTILEEVVNGVQKNLSLSSPQNLDCKEYKGSLTCVAVCFDGKKFTCGFEKCRRTFTKARDIQKHLKFVHPEEVKVEKRGHKQKKKDKRSKSKAIKMLKNSEGKNLDGPSTKMSNHEKNSSTAVESARRNTTAPLNQELNDTLRDVLLALSQLSLNSSSSRNVPHDPCHSALASKMPQVSCHSALNASAPSSASLKKESKSHLTVVDAKKLPQKSELSYAIGELKDAVSDKDQSISNFHIQSTTKPYTCDIKDCCYQSVTSNALKHHYLRKHDFSKDDLKRMEIFKPHTFKPFRCHLCPKSYKHKRELIAHYIQVHNLSEAVVEQMRCSMKKKEDGKSPLSSKFKLSLKQTNSSLLKKETGKVQKRHVPTWQQRCQKKRGALWMSKIEWESAIKTEKKSKRITDPPLQGGNFEGKTEEGAAREGRVSRRLVAKGNLCYILTNYHKPFRCVHKDCNSAFTSQSGLVRHLQSVHHYKRSQLCLEGDKDLGKSVEIKEDSTKPRRFSCKHIGCGKGFYHYSSLARHNRTTHNIGRKLQSSGASDTTKHENIKQRKSLPLEEPIPRFKCTYANCNASYHLNSSLLRHTHQVHRDQTPQKPPSPPVHCKSEGCKRVFSQNSRYRKHVYYQHCNYDSLVVHLQSAHKKDKSDSGCQKKLIVKPSSQSLKDVPKLPLRQSMRHCPKPEDASEVEENVEQIEEMPEDEPEEEPVKSSKSKKRGELVFRTHEEALQMCQDRSLPAAYPCMVQNCDSVVKFMSSLRRHYIQCHKMSHHQVAINQVKLFYTVEQLEELIQKKSALSALPDLARSPNGVLKMEYQEEPEAPGGPSLAMSLHSIKTDQLPGQDLLAFSEDTPTDSSILVGADDLLYGESSGHTEQLPDERCQNQEDKLDLQCPTPPLVPPPPLDLSPPSTLRFTVDDNLVDSLCKDGCGKSMNVPTAISISVPLTPVPARQPLKRKNELSEPPPASPPTPTAKEAAEHSATARTFDLTTYKPMGFESSFLKFIQEKEKEDSNPWVTVSQSTCHRPDPPRRRDSHRRNCSVKENSQRGPTITRSRRSRSSPLKPLLSTGEYTSIRNLHFILERALRGCGDQAIKQLQYLKPVVVLERSKFSASLLNLFPSETKV